MKPLILAFETSCDDTSVAVMDGDYQVLSNLISSQLAHNEYGGVVPELASRLHLKNILPLTELALKKAEVTFADIDAVAVSVNPGLIGSLLVGVSFAKALAYSINKPLIAVNHMLAHIWANKFADKTFAPPFLALVVSGGHTELVNFTTKDDFSIVGKTRDDAAGEAFDKTAKLLGLGYPGGPVIDRLARTGNASFITFPIGLNRKDNYDFSFSGLKTAIMNYTKDKPADFLEKHKNDIAASVQEAIVEALFKKTVDYMNKYGIVRLIIAGGVSANGALRKKFLDFSEKKGCQVFIPPLQYCMDNAAMVAAYALEKFHKKEFSGLELNAFSQKGVRYL